MSDLRKSEFVELAGHVFRVAESVPKAIQAITQKPPEPLSLDRLALHLQSSASALVQLADRATQLAECLMDDDEQE